MLREIQKALKATDFTVVNPKTNVKYPVSKIAVDSKNTTKVTPDYVR